MYRKEYADYYQQFAEPDSPKLRDANPSVVIIPGIGLFSFGKNKKEARITSEFFVNAIHVMAGASALAEDAEAAEETCRKPSGRSIPRISRAFTTMWRCRCSKHSALSIGRLKKRNCSAMPPELEFSRKVIVVVGGGSGIGRLDRAETCKARRARSDCRSRREGGGDRWPRRSAKLSSAEEVLPVSAGHHLAGEHSKALRAVVLRFRRHRRIYQHSGDLPGARTRMGKMTMEMWSENFRN